MFILDGSPMPRVHEPIKMDLQRFEEAKRRMLRRLGHIEDLFTDMERKDKVPARKGRGRGKKSMADLFAELKVQMVMNIYACSAERAKEIIDGRALELLELECETSIPL